MWHVYMLLCKDNTLYTGITNDLNSRLDTHNQGRGAKYTRGRIPAKLVYKESFSTRSQASIRETVIKKLSRAQKLHLIST